MRSPRRNSEEDLEGYEPSFRLIEEARKSWNHAISDKIVYSIEPFESNLNPSVHIAKNYIEGNVWIECHLTFEAERNRHYVVLLDFNRGLQTRRKVRKPIMYHRAVNGNSSVLVNIANRVQSPEKTASDCCGIRSMVRLKRFDDVACICGHPGSLALKGSPRLFGEFIQDRELSSLRQRRSQLSEIEDQLIQRRSQRVEEVSRNEGNMIGDLLWLNPDSVASILNIILKEKSIGLRFVEGSKLIPHCVKVFLRPFGLQIGIDQTRRG